MPFIATPDGARLFYKDWGSGPPVVFSHGWPLNSDAWDVQLKLVADAGYRGIAHDRRGHGRSSHTWSGHTMDTYADDLAVLVRALDLHDAVHVGHSTGGGEIVRYTTRHGTSRVGKIVLLGAVPPLMLKTDDNPAGLPIDSFDAVRSGLLADRAQYYRDLAEPFYGRNREDAKVSEGVADAFWLMCMQASLHAAFEGVAQSSETDFSADLVPIDVPTLVAHGTDDQIVPIEASALRAVHLIEHAILRVYPGAPHGLTGDFQNAFNADLLTFLSQ